MEFVAEGGRVLKQAGAIPLTLLDWVSFPFDFVFKGSVAISRVKNLFDFPFVMRASVYVCDIVLDLDWLLRRVSLYVIST
jgi:hypothetical protein